MTQSELKERTKLSIRSVKGSLKLLKERNLINEYIVLKDIRRKKYSLRLRCNTIKQHKITESKSEYEYEKQLSNSFILTFHNNSSAIEVNQNENESEW